MSYEDFKTIKMNVSIENEKLNFENKSLKSKSKELMEELQVFFFFIFRKPKRNSKREQKGIRH